MMKKQYFLNAKIIDPKNSIDELGGLIIGENGKIEAIGKKVNQNNIPSREKYIDLKEKFIFPGLVDMRVFVGEPGYEYKENFRTLSNAALSGGVTSAVTMPNTSPVIDNVSMVDFLKRRGRDNFKYIHCDPDPPQLYNLDEDPLEKNNLAFDSSYSSHVENFSIEVSERWNSEKLRLDIINTQKSRRALHSAMEAGAGEHWDYNPPSDASQK